MENEGGKEEDLDAADEDVTNQVVAVLFKNFALVRDEQQQVTNQVFNQVNDQEKAGERHDKLSAHRIAKGFCEPVHLNSLRVQSLEFKVVVCEDTNHGIRNLGAAKVHIFLGRGR